MAVTPFPISGSATKSSKQRRARQADEGAAKCLGFENRERYAAEIWKSFRLLDTLIKKSSTVL